MRRELSVILSLPRRTLGVLRGARRGIRDSGGLRIWLFYLPGPGPWLMSWLRRRWVLFRNPHAHIEFQGPVYLGPGFSLDMPRGGTFVVGPGVEFRRGFRAEFANADTRITVGGGTAFTYGVVIQCASSIEIGEGCLFAQGVLIVDGSHRFRDLERPVSAQGYDLRPLRIADHVGVMSNCTVIASIGERTLVGANAAVTQSLPAYCVAVGVPARVIEYFGPPGQEPAGVARSASAETAG